VRPVAALLPWQLLLLAYGSGIWMLREPWAGLAALCLIALCNRLAGRVSPRPAILVLAAATGLTWAWVRLPAPPEYPAWLDQRPKGSLAGIVAETNERPGGRLEIVLDAPKFRFQDGRTEPLPGALVWTWQDPAFRPTPGSRVRLDARPHATGGFDNPGGVDWAWRWRLGGVFYRAYTLGNKEGAKREAPGVEVEEEAPLAPAEAWRLSLRQAILDGAGPAPAPGPEGAATPGSAAGMVLGLITGERFAIDKADLDLVRRASLSHLLAVSGMNLAAVVAMGWCLAALAGLAWPGLYLRIPRPKLAVLLGMPLALSYLWLARFEPSLMRAALMFGCWGTLLLLNRSRILLDGLTAALAIMLLWNPLDAFSLGLQLSAAAVAGLTLLTPLGAPLLRWLRRRGRWTWPLALLAGWALVTLCAQVAVMPIQAQVFGEASPHLYLNLLWVPVVEWLAQPPAYIGALTALWLPSVGHPMLQASATVCGWMLSSLRAMDNAGLLEIFPIRRPVWPEFLGYLLLVGGLAYAFRLPVRRRIIWLGAGLLLLGGPTAVQFWENSRDGVSLTMLDVGQGQSLLLEVPGGRRYLVDGGGVASGSFDIGRAVLAPTLTWGRGPALDGIVMSHPDRDHAGGLNYPLGHFRVGFLAGNGHWPESGEFARALSASGLMPRRWQAGDALDLGDGLRLEVLHPPEGYPGSGNNASLVLRLVWRGRGLAILPGDAGTDALAALAATGRDIAAEVLVVPHHGSKSALAPAFYNRVGAEIALISTGRGNSFGLPSPAVTEALAARGTRLANTATSGAVTVRWEGPRARPALASRR